MQFTHNFYIFPKYISEQHFPRKQESCYIGQNRGQTGLNPEMHFIFRTRFHFTSLPIRKLNYCSDHSQHFHYCQHAQHVRIELEPVPSCMQFVGAFFPCIKYAPYIVYVCNLDRLADAATATCQRGTCFLRAGRRRRRRRRRRGV